MTTDQLPEPEEKAFWSRPLSREEIAAVDTHLAAKYGIALSGDTHKEQP